jgi:Do/DeqQ family serine protease
MRRLAILAIVVLLGLARGAAPGSAATEPSVLPSLGPMLERVAPGVVNLSVRGTIPPEENPLLQDPFFRRFFEDPLFRRFFGIPEQLPGREVQSIGSGVIIDAAKGYVVTNHHVIANADEVVMILRDRRRLDAKVVGSDPEADIAVLKVEPNELTEVLLGDSDELKVGDFVVAIGNPFGLGQTATLGIVSALGRSGIGLEGYEDFIQTDASINPGNSGGALVTQDGKLIGINAAIISRTGVNVGVGFAIPINMVRALVDEILEYGEVRRGQLGVLVQDLTAELAEALGADVTGGAVVSQVFPDSPAQAVGLEPGDVIVSLDGRPLRDSSELRNRIGLMDPGDNIRIEVLREGSKFTVETALGERPAPEVRAEREEPVARLAGVELGPVPQAHPLFGKVEGVLVSAVAPGSRAATAGLRSGDVIVSVNRKPVSSPAEVWDVAQASGDEPLLLHLRRGEGAIFLVIR